VKISQNLGKISWSLADKMLYVGYGLVQLLQIQAVTPAVYGLLSLLIALNTWIMLLTDGSALQGIVQFGQSPEERRRVNTLALLIHIALTAFFVLVIFILQDPLAHVLNEPKFAEVALLLPIFSILTVPRMFCLKILYRDLRMKELFITDAVWFGVRTSLTLWMLSQGTLSSFEDVVLIDLLGMGASSLTVVILTRRDLVFGWKGSVTLRQYLEFGVPLAVGTGLYSTPRQLDGFLVGSYFGLAAVGLYTSAKTLYRIFEQAFDAVFTLVHPAAVRLVAQGRHDELRTMVTKAISFTLIPVVVVVAALESGASQLIVPLLGPKYAAAVGHFNVLTLSALAMPFTMMSAVMVAFGHSRAIVHYTALGLVLTVTTLVVLGEYGLEQYVGLGIVVNTMLVGWLCVRHVQRELRFPWSQLVRAVADVRNHVSGRKGGSV
jgi:O-antigen/teichoic acid export membrane protein